MKDNRIIREFRSMTSFALRQPLRCIIQHHLNSLHVYSLVCRLRFSRKAAHKMASMYEQIVHPLLYGRMGEKVFKPVLVSCRENTGIERDHIWQSHAKPERRKNMFESSFFEIFIIVTILLPYILVVAGLVVLEVYAVYLLLQQMFSHIFYLTHRKAH